VTRQVTTSARFAPTQQTALAPANVPGYWTDCSVGPAARTALVHRRNSEKKFRPVSTFAGAFRLHQWGRKTAAESAGHPRADR